MANQRDAAQQDGFLREVDEALREQELLDLARRYGKPLAAAIIALLVGLGAWLWYDHTAKQAAAERSERTIQALDRLQTGGPGVDTAVRDLDRLVGEGSPAARANTRLLRAGIELQQGRREDALRDYAAVSADQAAPAPLRDLATVREVALRFDTLPPQQVIDRLRPLAAPGNPWFGSAGELTGMAYLRLGRADLAGTMFAAVARDANAPQSLRARMRQIAGQLGVDPGPDPAAATAGAAAK